MQSDLKRLTDTLEAQDRSLGSLRAEVHCLHNNLSESVEHKTWLEQEHTERTQRINADHEALMNDANGLLQAVTIQSKVYVMARVLSMIDYGICILYCRLYTVHATHVLLILFHFFYSVSIPSLTSSPLLLLLPPPSSSAFSFPSFSSFPLLPSDNSSTTRTSPTSKGPR